MKKINQKITPDMREVFKSNNAILQIKVNTYIVFNVHTLEIAIQEFNVRLVLKNIHL